MPYNGTGTFVRNYSWVQDAANGIVVDATRMDTDTNDIASGLSDCVTRDGQSPALANLPMGGFKFTGLANGAAPTDSVNYGQVFSSPTFTTPRALATPSLGDSSTLLATTAFVASTAFTTALPAQTGNSGKFVTTNGVTASWAAIPPATGSIIYLAATAGAL